MFVGSGSKNGDNFSVPKPSNVQNETAKTNTPIDCQAGRDWIFCLNIAICCRDTIEGWVEIGVGMNSRDRFEMTTLSPIVSGDKPTASQTAVKNSGVVEYLSEGSLFRDFKTTIASASGIVGLIVLGFGGVMCR